jgi:hypothetical protein
MKQTHLPHEASSDATPSGLLRPCRENSARENERPEAVHATLATTGTKGSHFGFGHSFASSLSLLLFADEDDCETGDSRAKDATNSELATTLSFLIIE